MHCSKYNYIIIAVLRTHTTKKDKLQLYVINESIFFLCRDIKILCCTPYATAIWYLNNPFLFQISLCLSVYLHFSTMCWDVTRLGRSHWETGKTPDGPAGTNAFTSICEPLMACRCTRKFPVRFRALRPTQDVSWLNLENFATVPAVCIHFHNSIYPILCNNGSHTQPLFLV